MKGLCHLICRLAPNADSIFLSFRLCQEALLELVVNGDDSVVGLLNILFFLLRHNNVGNADRQCADRGVVETLRLDLVEHGACLGGAQCHKAVVYNFAQLLLAHNLVDLVFQLVAGDAPVQISQILRNCIVEYNASRTGLDDTRFCLFADLLCHADVDLRLHVNVSRIVGQHSLVGVCKIHSLALGSRLDNRQIIGTDDHILRR